MSSLPGEDRHREPSRLLRLHERAHGGKLDGHGIQAWVEWEMEAMRWRVSVEISREDLVKLVAVSETLLKRERPLG